MPTPQIDPEIAALAREIRRDDRSLTKAQALAAATAMYEELDNFAGQYTAGQRSQRTQVLTAYAREWDNDNAAGLPLQVTR